MLAFKTVKVDGGGAPTRTLVPLNVKKFPSTGIVMFEGITKSAMMLGSSATAV